MTRLKILAASVALAATAIIPAAPAVAQQQITTLPSDPGAWWCASNGRTTQSHYCTRASDLRTITCTDPHPSFPQQCYLEFKGRGPATYVIGSDPR
jgi:hypothetical protein